MKSIIKNAIDDIAITITDSRSTETITITSAKYQVFNTSDTSVQAEADATITDNISTSPDVSGMITTTASGFIACNTYYVLFTIVIGSYTPKYKIPFKVT